MSQTRSTYRAVQAVSPGKLELTEKPLLDPPRGHVRIRIARRSVGSMRSVKASKAGQSASVSGWGFSAAAADTAFPAAPATS